MKFSIALGLLMAGLVSGKITQADKVKVDKFLRDNEKIGNHFELKEFKPDGQHATVTYHKEGQTIKLDVTQAKGKYKVVGQEDRFEVRINSQASSMNPMMPMMEQIFSSPLSLFMPGFQPVPQIKNPHHNVFEAIEKKIKEIQHKRRQKKQRRSNGQSLIQKLIEDNLNQNHQIMISGFDQPSFLIGGNGKDMWATTPLDLPQPVLIGDDGHDFWQNKPLIGGEDNDLEIKKQLREGKKYHGMKGKNNHPKIKPNWMKDIEKKVNFNPLQNLIESSILNQGQKLLGDTFRNIKSKFVKKQVQKPQQLDLGLLLLGGQNDPDHFVEKVKQPVEKVLNIFSNLLKQTKHEEAKPISKPVEPKPVKQVQINDIDEDESEQLEEEGKPEKLELSVK